MQALVTLNDPVFVEASQALARRMLAAGLQDTRAIANHGFELCMIRPPSQQESDLLVKLFDETQAEFKDDIENAKRLGIDPLNPPAEGTDPVDLAAWTTVANVLLNLDEMFMKR